MSRFVVDASVALKWYVPEVHAGAALRLLEPGRTLSAPELLIPEAANILWKKSRRGELSAGEARRILRALGASPVQIHPCSGLEGAALEIALETGCTAYDGFYLALAMASGCPLATADQALVRLLEPGRHRRHLCWVGDVPATA